MKIVLREYENTLQIIRLRKLIKSIHRRTNKNFNQILDKILSRELDKEP